MFTSIEFKTAWEEWKEYYQKKTLSQYNEISERKAISSLFKKCHGIEQLAIDSIDYSIEKNWASIYIKPSENGYGQNNGSSKPINGKQGGTSTDRVEALRNW